MGKYLMKLIILIPYLLSMITIFYEYSPLISPLFNDRLHFMYGDFSTIVNPYSGIDRFNQTFYVFNQHLGSQALDVNRALLLESLSALSKIFNLTDSQVQSLIILLSVSLGLYGIGSLIKLFIDDTRAQYILFFGLSIFYYLNLWSTERIGHFWIWTGYAVFPLLLYFGMSFISRGDKRNVILYAIIFAIYGIIPHTFIYISMLTFMLVLIGICKGDFKRATSFVVGVFGLYFLLNSGIFLVLFNSASGGYPIPITLQELQMLSRYGTMIKVLSFSNNWWPQVPLEFIHQNILFRISGIIIFSIVLSIGLLNSQTKSKLYILLPAITLLLITLFLVQGTNNVLLLSILKIFENTKILNLFAPFREWGKLSVLIPPILTLTSIVGISSINKPRIKQLSIILLLILVMVNIFSSPFKLYISEVYSPTQIPTEYYDAYNKINTNCKLLWIYPKEATSVLGTWRYTWNSSKAVSTNLEFSIGSEYNRNFEFIKLLQQKEAPYNLLSSLNIMYIVYRTDILGAKNFAVNYTFEQSSLLNKGYLTVCSLKNSSSDVFTSYNLLNCAEENGNLLYSLFYSFSPNALVMINNRDSFSLCKYKSRAYITSLGSLIKEYIGSQFVSTYHTSNSILLPSKDWTNNGAPERYWSIAYTSDPLHGEFHPYLKEFNIENWQSDYNYGVVFTWAQREFLQSILKDIPPSVNWSFNNNYSIKVWKNYTPHTQWGVNQSLKFDPEYNALRAELYGSSWGWKTINSPLIPANSSRVFYITLKIKAQNAHEVHIKIFELNESKKIISGKYITGVGSGTFNWKTISFNYQPQSEDTRYIQLQIWHGHETDKPLPNIIWIDDVKVYDITNYTKPVTLDIPFKVDKTDNYKLFIRYFKNQKGGAIRVYLDGTPIYIKTKDQLNKFVWEDLGTFKLEKGKHKIILENVRGFNAVNLFALIPEKEYNKARKEAIELLQNKTIIYLFEAESDLYRENTEIIKDFNASNGEAIKFDQKGKAWQNVEIVKNSTYRLALKGNGTFNISIGDYKYVLTVNNSTFEYTPLFYLRNGEYKLEITPTSKDALLDVVWLYSTDKNETLEELFQTNETPATVQDYTKINPTLWKVKVNATKPFMLTFAESYDPLWEARVYKDGKLVEKVSPVPVYGVINGFWINQTGDLEIVLRYTPQDWFERGLMVSLTTFLLSVFYIFYDWRREKGDKWAKRLEKKFKKLTGKVKRKLCP